MIRFNNFLTKLSNLRYVQYKYDITFLMSFQKAIFDHNYSRNIQLNSKAHVV